MKIDDGMIEYLLRSIENKSSIPLIEMNNRMRTHNPDKPHVTTQAISQRLDGELYSKDIRAVSNGTLPKGRLNVWSLPAGYWDLDFTSRSILRF